MKNSRIALRIQRLYHYFMQRPLVWLAFLLWLASMWIGMFGNPLEVMPGAFWFFVTAVFAPLHPGNLANPFFLASFFYSKRNKLGLFLAALGFISALSWVYFPNIYACFKRCGWEPVEGYYLGYMLWLWSFVLLVMNQLLPRVDWLQKWVPKITFIALVLLITAIPYLQSKRDAVGYFAVREAFFQQACENSAVSIYETLEQVPQGIYFDYRHLERIYFEDAPGWHRFKEPYEPRYYQDLDFLEQLPFYEKESRSYLERAQGPYWLVSDEFPDGIGVTTVVSEIGIFENNPELHKSWDQLRGNHIYIQRMSDGAILAEMKYIWDRDIKNSRICPDHNAEINVEKFYKDVFLFAE